jgi:site-specific recombinase XerD
MANKDPIITFTDEQCLIGGIPYPGIPLLINYDYYILEGPSDWLRYLVTKRRKAISSVRQYAYHLKHWWSYINQVGAAWDEVNDFTMMQWREQCLLKNDAATVNSYVSSVFKMYLWAEKNGYTNGLIGEVDFGKNIRPPLTVEVKFSRTGSKIYLSPLFIRTPTKPILPTPTNNEITKVHEALVEMYGDNIGLMIRDALILTYEEQTGTRRAEILSLKRSQIPKWDEIITLEETNDKKEIIITGKGNKKRAIWVGADLLSQTRDYIEEERQTVVKRMRERIGSNFKNPEEIFLSSKTGRSLHPDTISQKFARAFRKAGVQGSGQRVRARFLSNLVEHTFESEFEKLGSVPDLTSILLPVAQIAGHSSVTTLQPYLAVAKKRLLRRTTAERAAMAEERAIAVERRLIAAQTKLKAVNGLDALIKAIKSSNKKRIVDELHHLLKVFSQ